MESSQAVSAKSTTSTPSELKSGIDHLLKKYGSVEEVESFVNRTYEKLIQDIGEEDFPLALFIKSFLGQYKPWWKCPGSTDKGKHHCYIGGLAFHSVTAAILGQQIATHYRSIGMEVNRPLVIAGILLHDVGKAECYAPKTGEWKDYRFLDEPEFKKTPLDKKFHHIPAGFQLLSQFVSFNKIISKQASDELLHIILSHHGHRAWSSPVIPATTEAYIVHAVEMMDGYVEKFYLGQTIKDIYGN